MGLPCVRHLRGPKGGGPRRGGGVSPGARTMGIVGTSAPKRGVFGTVMPRFAYTALAALALAGSLSACGGGAPERVAHSAPSASRSYTPPGPPHDPWGPWIREASRRFDVPERWIREVMRQESGGRANATSPVGAMGLMQVMPGTYAELRRRYSLGDDPYHPYDSIMAGTAYIREMYDLYGSPAFLAAYNAGPRRLEDFLYNNRGLPAETRNYVARVGPRVITASPVRRAPAEVYAAAEIPLNIPQGPRRMDPGTRTMLAEQRSIREQNARFAGTPEPEPQPRAVAVAESRATRSAAASLLAQGGGAVPAGARFAPGGFAPGSVVAMAPIPDGSTPEGAARLAAAASAPEPERIVVARMDPIPDGSTPEGAARLAESASRIAPPPEPMPAPVAVARAPATPAAPVRVAEARGSALPPPVSRNAPPPPAAAAPLPPRTLGFISTAQAGTLPAGFRAAQPGPANRWGVQVGAFASENLARSAAQQASASGVGGRVAVEPVQVGRTTLYRARVVGLTQTAAQQACDRLRRTGCQLVSPEG